MTLATLSQAPEQPMKPEAQVLAYALTQAVADADQPAPTLEDIAEWVYRVGDAQYTKVQSDTAFRGAVPDGMARELAIGRRAIDLMAKLIERQDEVLFLLRAKPRSERGRR